MDVRAIQASEVGPDYNAVILTCKAYDLDDAMRDIERRGRTEVDHIIGFLLQKARGTGLEVQTLLLAHTHINANCEQIGRIAGNASNRLQPTLSG